MTEEEAAVVKEGTLAYKRRLEDMTNQRDLLLAALSRLCRELQSPAMEHLATAVQSAWSDAFDLCDRIASL